MVMSVAPRCGPSALPKASAPEVRSRQAAREEARSETLVGSSMLATVEHVPTQLAGSAAKKGTHRGLRIYSRFESGVAASDVLFGVMVVAVTMWYARLYSNSFFQADDWRIMGRPQGLSHLLEPHNGHLSAVPLLEMQALLHTVGLRSYMPYTLVGLASFAAVAVAVYVLARARVGRPLALVAAMSVLLIERLSLPPILANYHLALVFAVVAAWAMPRRSHRADLMICAALALGLCSSGVGVAVAGAAASHTVLANRRVSRALAVGIPVVGWLLWYHHFGGSTRRGSTPPLPEMLGVIGRGTLSSFSVLASGVELIGALLAGLAALLAAWRWSHDRPSLATQMAWTTAVATWWTGLVISRPDLVDGPGSTRYSYVAGVFVIFSAIPASPVRPRLPAKAPKLAASIAAVLIVALAIENADGIRKVATSRVNKGDRVVALLVEIRAADPPLPPDVKGPQPVAKRTVGEIEASLDRFGIPPQVVGNPDQLLIEHHALIAQMQPPTADRPSDCASGPVILRPDQSVSAYARDDEATILVHRYGSESVELRALRPGRSALVRTQFPALDGTPWIIDGRDVCFAERRLVPPDGAGII